MDFDINKKSAGIFWTVGDPFCYDDIIRAWLGDIFGAGKVIPSICEPYAGANSLLVAFEKHFPEETKETKWSAFDIVPRNDESQFPKAQIRKANTLMSIPESPYSLIVTNPPYLAKNSARRQKLDFPFEYKSSNINSVVDLYQIALDTALASAEAAVMLIPESFITSSYSKQCCDMVISLPGTLFDDTDMPVCLAFMSRNGKHENKVYASDGTCLGTMEELRQRSEDLIGKVSEHKGDFAFNVPSGEIGLYGCDSTSGPTIRFVDGDEIPSDSIKVSSRAITRIASKRLAIPADDDQKKIMISKANDILTQWRNETDDVFLTAFKGTMKDGRYRRRLSYDIAAAILTKALGH